MSFLTVDPTLTLDSFPTPTPTLAPTTLVPSTLTTNPTSAPTATLDVSPFPDSIPQPPSGLTFIVLGGGIAIIILAVLSRHLFTRYQEHRGRRGYKGVGEGWGLRRGGVRGVRRGRGMDKGRVVDADEGVGADKGWGGLGRARREEDLWASD